nr:J domain-containing protein [Treponema sp.]
MGVNVDFDSDEILNANYYDIFTNDLEMSKSKFHALQMKYHPDKSDNNFSISAKINELYLQAVEHINNNSWKCDNVLNIQRKDGKVSTIKNYLYSASYELGSYWISNTVIVYSFNDKHFFDNYLFSVKYLKYADANMKLHFSTFVPNIIDSFEAKDGLFYLIIKKDKDEYPLHLIKKVFDKKQAAWVMTKLLNICNFLCYNNLVHNGICIENLFVNLKQHSVHLYGGWQYCIQEGEKMIGTVEKVFKNMNPDVKSSKQASFVTDLDSSKYVLKDLFGLYSFPQLKTSIGSAFASFLST